MSIDTQGVYRELVVLYRAAYRDLVEAGGDYDKSAYHQGKKDAYRVALSLLAETEAMRDSWKSLNESSPNDFMSRLGASEALAKEAYRMLTIGPITKSEREHFINWYEYAAREFNNFGDTPKPE